MDQRQPIDVLDLDRLHTLLGTGDFATLEREARTALTRHPDHPRLRQFLGVALFKQERSLDEAIACLIDASAAAPADPNLLNHLALALKTAGRHDDAHAAWLRALAQAPDHPELLANLGDNLTLAGRPAEALPWLHRALKRAPGLVAARANLAHALLRLEQVDDALTLTTALLAEGHRPVPVLAMHALALQRSQRGVESEPILAELLAQAPDHAEALAMQAVNAVAHGQFATAETLYRQALTLQPELPAAWSGLAHLRRMTSADQDWYRTAQRIATRPDLTLAQRALLDFAMGKYCDDVADYPQAFAHYRAANEYNKSARPPDDRTLRAALIDHLIRTFDADRLRRLAARGHPAPRPLFIVGLPRSGTSLTEQILASHPDTCGAGELTFWSQALATHDGPLLGGDWPAELTAALADDYLRVLNRHSATAQRVINKMPGNFNWIGIIHAIFPNARFLHTQRHPIDTCLSIYFQDFNARHTYANDLDDLAEYYRQYRRLMAHWRAVLPPGVLLDVPYEALVEDQEGWTRRILEFIGLDWDARCLEFHQTARRIGTASNWQARQPIYQTSRERWRHYEAFVGPLLPLLALHDPHAAATSPTVAATAPSARISATPMTDTTPIVARQYTAYSYPHPIADMREAIAGGYYEFGAPHLFWPLLWPEGKRLDGLRVLIAGCGTNQAAYTALTLPGARITAIDLSRTSLEHSQYLKEQHGLDHLTLHQMNLLEVGQLGEQYDYIVSTGVLHHLPDPDAGLRALRDVLAPDGVMNLMVYGRYHRLGVYMLQQAFKLLGCQQQTPEDVALVKATLAALEPTHSVHRYLKSADDLAHDSGLVDTFLHPQDRAYSVPEVLSFAHDNGLAFWDWTDRLDYSHTATIPEAHPVHARLQTLNPVAQWAVVELLTQTRGTHRFLLCHPERANTTPRLRFDSDDWLDWIPIRRYPTAILQMANPATGELAKLKRGWHEFTLSPEATLLMEQIDGGTAIRHLLAALDGRVPPELARGFFARMHEWGHLLYARVPFVDPQLKGPGSNCF